MPLLLHIAAEWFNDALIVAMQARGWPRLSRTQSLVFLSIDPDGTRPSELARRLGITRQSTRELLFDLVTHQLVTIEADPEDRRSKVVRLAPRAAALGIDAAIVTQALEQELARRLGARDAAALRRIVRRDWGQPPDVSA